MCVGQTPTGEGILWPRRSWLLPLEPSSLPCAMQPALAARPVSAVEAAASRPPLPLLSSRKKSCQGQSLPRSQVGWASCHDQQDILLLLVVVLWWLWLEFYPQLSHTLSFRHLQDLSWVAAAADVLDAQTGTSHMVLPACIIIKCQKMLHVEEHCSPAECFVIVCWAMKPAGVSSAATLLWDEHLFAKSTLLCVTHG